MGFNSAFKGLMLLAALRVPWSSSSLVFAFCAYAIVLCNPTHGNLMGSEPVTVVAYSIHRHDQSIGLGNFDSSTAWQPDWNDKAPRHALSASFCRVCRGTCQRVLAVHFGKVWPKYHPLDIAGKCTDNWVGHQWHHITRSRRSYVGSCFRKLCEGDHDTINGSFLCCWLHRG